MIRIDNITLPFLWKVLLSSVLIYSLVLLTQGFNPFAVHLNKHSDGEHFSFDERLHYHTASLYFFLLCDRKGSLVLFIIIVDYWIYFYILPLFIYDWSIMTNSCRARENLHWIPVITSAITAWSTSCNNVIDLPAFSVGFIFTFFFRRSPSINDCTCQKWASMSQPSHILGHFLHQTKNTTNNSLN